MTSTTPANLSEHAMTTDPAAMLEAGFRDAIARATGLDAADADPMIRPAQNPDFGDFQSNAAMGLAKKLARKPRDLAGEIVDALDIDAIAESVEIAGPGFINIRLRAEALAAALIAMDEGDLGITPSADTHAVAIDMCGVNVAKQMHVGHLRSTIIGDALARCFERLGRTVHRENHLGDWGLPIAMVLHQLREQKVDLDALTLSALDAAYRDAQLTAKADLRGLAKAVELHAGPHRVAELEEQNAGAQAHLEAAKQTLVKLQAGDESLRRDWQKLIDVTLAALYDACDTLNVRIGPENNRGESTYRDELAGVVDAFLEDGKAGEDKGAIVVRFANRERPMLIRKSDGGYLYATTDLAAVRYRVQKLDADRMIYVVDARQRDHFRDVFDGIRLIGWDKTPDGTHAQLTHVPFGSVLGEDGSPLKTRSGENVTLASLLDEAVQRGANEVMSRAADPDAPTHGMGDDELHEIGRQLGIGAIKFADLANDLVKDYVFSMDRMISFEGKTGPYLQYAHARICSIFSKAGVLPDESTAWPLEIAAPEEKQLALKLLRYPETIESVAESLEPHRLCTFLYELAEAYNAFYQHCPVATADEEAVRQSRLRLSNLTRRVLRDGLGVLGIDAPARM